MTTSIRQAKEHWRSSQGGRHQHEQLQQQQQQLIPGIADDITLGHICGKLSWKAFFVLSAVSRAWRHSIQSRKVYDARVVSHSTEKLKIVSLWTGGLALRSARHKPGVTLPSAGYPVHRCLSLDGKIYALGRYPGFYGSNTVAVLDVAGRRQWQQCASMLEPRNDFGFAVMLGNIYVFGGASIQNGVHKFCGSEVYDPKKDLWSPIKPMAERYFPRVVTLGEQAFVNGVLDRFRWLHGNLLDVYHPIKDEWKNLCEKRSNDFLFVAREKLHSINESEIYFYNAVDNSWTKLHSYSLSFIRCRSPCESVVYCATACLAVDDEILVDLRVGLRGRYRRFDALSKGFGSEQKEIVLQEVVPDPSHTFAEGTILL